MHHWTYDKPVTSYPFFQEHVLSSPSQTFSLLDFISHTFMCISNLQIRHQKPFRIKTGSQAMSKYSTILPFSEMWIRISVSLLFLQGFCVFFMSIKLLNLSTKKISLSLLLLRCTWQKSLRHCTCVFVPGKPFLILPFQYTCPSWKCYYIP